MKKNGLFLRKSIRAPVLETENAPHEMKRHLGSWHLTAIGIGAIIGAGIFVITGTAAADYAGPGIILSFILAAIVCIFAGLCYAELSSMIPISGGAYSYSYVCLGEFPAWLVGWSILAQYLFTAATVAVGWSGYFTSLFKDFGLVLPNSLTTSPITYSDGGWGLSGAFLNLPAMFMVGCVGLLISSGLKAATRFNNIMVVVKLGTILLFVILGISFIQADNLTPLIPENTGVFGHYGLSGVLRGTSIVFFAYTGFDLVATLAQETIHPQKDLPRGILGSLGISALAYIATSLVLVGVVSYKLLGVPDPMSVALHAMGSSFGWLKFIVKIAIIAGLSTVTLGNLLAQSRVFFAMGKDGLLPPTFSRLHKQTPSFSSITASLICLIISGLFPVSILGNLVSMSTLFIFAIVCLGVLLLRYKHPEIKRPFKVPLVPIIPAAGILGCIASMFFLPLATWLQLGGWLILGLLTYFAYGIKHSKLRSSST